MSTAARTIIAAAIALVLPAAADARWTRLRSANFEFIGDAPAGQMRQVAARLEQFREIMARALPGSMAVSPVPTVVMVFSTDRALNPVKPLFRGGTTEVGGYMQSGEDLNYIALNGEYLDAALITVFHEYAHMLVGNSVGRVPVWVNEGLAEFYDVMQGLEAGKTIVIGRAPAQHVDLLKSSTLMPVKELMSIDRNAQVYNEGSRRGVFYAESWALVHYLTLGNKERAGQFTKYLASLKAGVDAGQAFNDAFGSDVATLDRELFAYVRQVSFPALRLQFSEKVTADADRGSAMDDIEADVYVADLQARIGRESEARTRLQAILSRKPDAARASTVLGLIDYRARRFKDALPMFQRAATQDPHDGFVQTSFGRALVAMLNEQPGTEATGATLEQARTVLSRAVDIDPASAYAAGLLGYVELAIGRDLGHAISMLERAARLAPSREQYRLLLAEALIDQNEIQRAINLLGPLVAGGSADVRGDARRLLGAAADRKARADAPPSAAVATDATANTRTTESTSGRTSPLVTLSAVADLVRPETGERFRLDLRPVKEGETRVLGLFRAIDCQRDRIVLNVEADGRLLHLGARQIGDVDFVTYRQEPPGSVNCGPLATPMRVFATFRAAAADAVSANHDGDAVAIELLPDGYLPR